MIASMPFSIKRSVLVSMDEVASSRISTGGCATAALAMAAAVSAPGKGCSHRCKALFGIRPEACG